MRLGARRGGRSSWVSVATILTITLLGVLLTSSSQAQPVFRGTITFAAPGGTLVANLEVILHPGAPATYTITFGGQHIDSGLITATQSGSSVSGLIISPQLGGSCPFTATLTGGTATGTLLCTVPGASATFVLTQV
jgi:hypothetical protein